MDYYIIKRKKEKIREDILDGIFHIDKDAKIVDSLEKADIAVLQQGWTRSRIAVAEQIRASQKLHIKCQEGYLYTDNYSVHLN